MKKLLFLIPLILIAKSVSAQTTGCLTGPSSVTISTNTVPVVYWCTAASDGAYVYGLPTTKIPVSGKVAVTAPDANGLQTFKGTIPKQPKGNYQIKVSAYVLDFDGVTVIESGQSVTPFALSVADPKTAPPVPIDVYIDRQ